MGYVGRCEKCGGDVLEEHVTRVQALKRSTYAIYDHTCGWVGQIRFDSLEAYEKALKQKRRRRKRIQGISPEEIGRIVAGFRIDLDAVESVDDLELYWFDDRRYKFGVSS